MLTQLAGQVAAVETMCQLGCPAPKSSSTAGYLLMQMNILLVLRRGVIDCISFCVSEGQHVQVCQIIVHVAMCVHCLESFAHTYIRVYTDTLIPSSTY